MKTKRSAPRGFTLAETLIASVALALFLIIALAVMLPVLTYLSAAQAKIDTQSNAVPVLYKLQREIRQGDAGAVYYRPTPSATALPLPATLTSLTTFAIASAKHSANGDPCYPGAQFETAPSTGGPYYYGFEVYHLAGDGTLTCVFESWTSPIPTPPTAQTPTAAQADNAITAGLAVANPRLFGQAVFNVQMAVSSTPYVDFKIQALATVNGRTNATTYTQNILTRR